MHDLGTLCVSMCKRLELLIVITLVVCVYRKPAVIMIVGVNGGGKTTSLGICLLWILQTFSGFLFVVCKLKS